MHLVLIVDDQEDVLYMLNSALESSYEVQVARNGEEGWNRFVERQPELLLVDMHLPVMSGLDLLERVRQHDPLLPVLMMTGTGTLDSAVEALRLGAYDYLMKPFEDLDVVKHAMQRALETRRLRVENLRLAEDVRSANLFKSQLLRAVSHDFKNLLTVAIGYARLAQMAPSPEQTRESLEHIMGTSRLMALMAEDLSTYSQLDTNTLKLDCTHISLADCTRDAAHAALVDDDKHPVVGPAPDATAWADRTRTTQILTNLIGNAVKYSPRGGEIRIECQQDGDWISVAVRDRGLGIPPPELENLFKPFYRLERDSRSGTPGSGLGLTIVKNLVELHGGRIWAESAENEGTTFHFTLPTRAEQLPVAHRELAVPQAAPS
jgi:signal transduction histidine kinase